MNSKWLQRTTAIYLMLWVLQNGLAFILADTEGGTDLIHLENNCAGRKELPISADKNYGGIFQFSSLPAQNCSVRLAVQIPPGLTTEDKYNIYINVRESTMPERDIVSIYQRAQNDTRVLLSVLRAHYAGESSIALSVQQIKTKAFHHLTGLIIELTKSAENAADDDLTDTTIPTGRKHRIVFEYALVKAGGCTSEQPQTRFWTNWVYCPALNGYVYRRLACGIKNRFTCPNVYHRSKHGNNPGANINEEICNVFRDDFEHGLDSIWSARNATMLALDGIHQRSENVYVADGFLHIKASAQSDNATHMLYTVGHVSTGTAFNFAYGEVEFRAKFPKLKTFPTLTMMRLVRPDCKFDYSNACQTEALTLADYRSRAPNKVDVSVNHNFQDLGYVYSGEVDLTMDFHTYKMHWTREQVVWYIDNKEIHRLNESKDSLRIPTCSMQLLIEIAVYPRPEILPAESVEVVIDYISIRNDNVEVEQPMKELLISSSFALWKVWVTVISVVVVVVMFGLAACRIRRFTHRGTKRMRPCVTVVTVVASPAETESNENDSSDQAVDRWNEPLLFFGVLVVPEGALIFEHGQLGEGYFGVVRKATATNLSGWQSPCSVAVKTIRNTGTETENIMLNEEVKIHSQITRHVNIVNLLGITFSNNELHIILEYAEHGCLLTYLREHELLFGIEQGKEERNLCEESTALIVTNHGNTDSERPLQENDLLNFSFQISRGMTHLALHSIIHRDLAARNVLVCDRKVLKICDFGLSKQKSDYYRMPDSKERVPAKWMSPESMHERLFTEKSDVWSFGIVIWEVFSLGKVPYDGIIGEFCLDELRRTLKEGVRPVKPAVCPEHIYDIMNECWKYDAADRPTFAVLELRLERLLDKEVSSHYTFLDEPYVLFNASHGASETT